jgi:phosphogluconate dehydratase
MIKLCGHDGMLDVLEVDLASREAAAPPPPPVGTGRELFAFMRATAEDAERGGSAMLAAMD